MRMLIAAIIGISSVSAFADQQRYPTPTRNGRERIQRTGTCPTGYVGKGGFCEALHDDTPRAYPKIKGVACPTGAFASGDACKAFR